ncbi:DUF1456 family protein [Halotalea alkalilenta]|uniref:DUF1456 family protein n=1 Tax=Halotalea alkalilenta TaxID=376489 RepID=UPI000488696E|nr:DUF1456 family protein [Halotalea alkalilenta]
MIHNDVLRSVRYTLDLHETRLIELFALADYPVERERLDSWLSPEGEEGFEPCPDEAMAHFLNGLVILRRGRDETRPPQPVELPVNNNMVLKKLRVAFELKDDDMHEILAAADFPLSKPELSALFRKKGHKNYRPAGDQLLRRFLRGLALRFREQV